MSDLIERQNNKPPMHWEPNPRYEQPQTVEEWDWRQDGAASDNSFDRSWKRLTYAYVRADPHAPDQMSLVLRGDLGRILGRLTHYTAHRELLMERKVEAADELAALRERVAAYRLLAVNEGWNHQHAAAYGHREYLRQRIEGIDASAERTIASGYDAAGYLRDGLAKQEASHDHG